MQPRAGALMLFLALAGSFVAAIEACGSFGAEPTAPGDLYFGFGVWTKAPQTGPLSVGYDNIAITLK